MKVSLVKGEGSQVRIGGTELNPARLQDLEEENYRVLANPHDGARTKRA